MKLAACLLSSLFAISCAAAAPPQPASQLLAEWPSSDTGAAANAVGVPAPVQTRPTLSAEARNIVFVLVPETLDAKEMAQVVGASLTEAGYRLAAPGEAHDARLVVSVCETADGPAEMKVTLTMMQGDRVVEALVVPVSAGGAPAREIDELVDRMTESSRLPPLGAEVAKQHTARRSAAQSNVRPAVEPEPVDENSAWSNTAARRCRNQQSQDACSKLEAYLQAFPNGTYAEAARAVLSKRKKGS